MSSSLIFKITVFVIHLLRGGSTQQKSDVEPQSLVTCWVCDSRHNEPDCVKFGNQETCEVNQVCFSEIRVENGNYRQSHSCKQRKACSALEQENYIHCEAGRPPCPNSICKPRLCRKCCWHEDLCNINNATLTHVALRNTNRLGSPPPKIKVDQKRKVEAALLLILPDGMEIPDIVEKN